MIEIGKEYYYRYNNGSRSTAKFKITHAFGAQYYVGVYGDGSGEYLFDKNGNTLGVKSVYPKQSNDPDNFDWKLDVKDYYFKAVYKDGSIDTDWCSMSYLDTYHGARIQGVLIRSGDSDGAKVELMSFNKALEFC